MSRVRSPYPPEAPIAIFRGRHVEIAPLLWTDEYLGEADLHGRLLDTRIGLAYPFELTPLTRGAEEIVAWANSVRS